MEEKPEDTRFQQIQELFNTRINPVLAGHGGFAEAIELKDDQLFIRVGGGCQGCGMANATIKQGIQGLVQRMFPDIKDVIDVTDHGVGTNPYFQHGK